MKASENSVSRDLSEVEREKSWSDAFTKLFVIDKQSHEKYIIVGIRPNFDNYQVEYELAKCKDFSELKYDQLKKVGVSETEFLNKYAYLQCK